MKCAIYARVSTEEQAKKYSIPAQLDLLRSFAQINNYEIFKEYVDEGISGTISDRPQLRELFNDAERGYFKIVLVYRIDRFFRNTLKLLSAVDKLEKIGVAFKSITENFDTTNPTGKFMISLLGSVAQLERDTFIERSKMGILRSVKEGHYMASVPLYGYKYDKETKKLKIHPEESEVVRLIFKLYQEPHSSQIQVAQKLDNMGFFSRKGRKWHDNQIHRVLTHPGYLGEWYYNSGSEKIMVKIPSLINKETFDNVQKLLKKRKRGANQKYNYLLVDYLYCGNCKRRMTVRSRKSIKKINNTTYGPYFEQHYYCLGRSLKKGCKMVWIRKDRIDSIVWREIKKYIKQPSLIKEITKEYHKKDQNKLESLKMELVKIASKLEKLELEDEDILRLYRKHIIDEDKLTSQMQEIEIEKQTLNQQKREIEIKIKNQKFLKIRLNTLEEFVKKIQNNIDNLTFEKKRKIIDLLVNKIFIENDGKIQLEMVVPDFHQVNQRQSWLTQETWRKDDFIIPITISSIWENTKIKEIVNNR